MRIVFLGTAAAVSTPSRDNTSLLVNDFLIDCSGNLFGKMKKVGYDPLKLQGIIITHGHVDHIYGLPSLIEMLRLSGRRDPLKIYVGRHFYELTEVYLEMHGLLYQEKGFEIELRAVNYEKQLLINDSKISIETFPVKHSVPNIGLKIRSNGVTVIYTSDTELCEDMIDLFNDVDLLIHESTCSYLYSKKTEGHTCAEDAARFAQLSNAKVLCLVHIGPEIDGNETKLINELKQYFLGKILIPNDLDRIVL
ncbi:MBL fold metallo-hydrolase [Thermotoga profunda]|uniref:MBL fold metallo-hydrolase n=1 Tax=Thermotoga profunda TaxID=1508420 RepID=UPI000597B514|nr:MBL fold metallo-hydrolase [Thermotoga profunda]